MTASQLTATDHFARIHFARIDTIRSIQQMSDELWKLPSDSVRRAVILYALAHSKFQFTWSHFAVAFDISETEWPPRPA
jgi:hypothetical protein